MFGGDDELFKDELAHFFNSEDREELHRILGQQYHAVVGNPPYITVKDKALNQLYRERYDACSGKYSLSVPFMERFFDSL
jgi:methylase of polypeptide subunit release factors